MISRRTIVLVGMLLACSGDRAGAQVHAFEDVPSLDATVEVAAIQSGRGVYQPVRLQLKVTELDGRRAARLAVKALPEPPSGDSEPGSSDPVAGEGQPV